MKLGAAALRSCCSFLGAAGRSDAGLLLDGQLVGDRGTGGTGGVSAGIWKWRARKLMPSNTSITGVYGGYTEDRDVGFRGTGTWRRS